MKKDEIANLSMKKLHTELNKIKDEVINNSKIHVDIEKEVLTIENKYKEYVNDKNIQNSVNGHITDIFDQSKKEALEIYNNLNIKKIHKNSVIAIGNFDGLHLGHQKVINEAKNLLSKNIATKIPTAKFINPAGNHLDGAPVVANAFPTGLKPLLDWWRA